MLTYQNYHRHSYYTNTGISDSTCSNEDYAKRANDLGHGIISTCEHGYQGRYIEGYELAEQYHLTFVFGTEAYFVKNRAEKERKSGHIYIGARTEEGRQAINDILAEANITGFYGRPRVDRELILSLPPNDVIVTTACIAFWNYGSSEEFVKELHSHFGRNFFLEVQAHNTPAQAELNTKILSLHNRLRIPLIFGCDSHYIRPSDAALRSDYLLSKGISYPDEEGWYLDYPDGEEVYRRFARQSVLSHQQILDAMANTGTFLEVERYQNPCFTKNVKCPTLYPDLSVEGRMGKYRELVWSAWEQYKREIPPARHMRYEEEIKKEIEIVERTNMADYFLLDHEVVRRGVQNGGIITTTGRGSGVSFLTNMLLGFTKVDRLAAPVRMYPERFMSPTRILEAKTLPDLDLNLGTVEPFARAQKEVLGEEHSYPMLAYGTNKVSSAWKLYAKSQGVDFVTANAVSEQIRRYETAKKHADESEKDSISALDYIEPRFHSIYRKSSSLRGVVSSWSVAPCSYLLYEGNIRREIGLVRIKDHLCCLMDGHWAEDYKFLKNDLLRVAVVELIDRIYKRIGVPKHSVSELLALTEGDDSTWEIYRRGCTLGINQVEQPGTSHRAAQYAPRNISELCAFVAAIRPGFQSMYRIFEQRKPFSYHIPSLDRLIQTPEMPNSFILYQEMAMAVLHYAGIPMSECYEIIKNIAKKRAEKVLSYRERFLSGFARAVSERELRPEEEAKETAERVWKILEDSSAYSFNASHSYCVALDSLYGAYLKSHYPLAFYETYLKIQEEKGDKDKMAAAREEAENYFGIRFPPYRYGQDNRTITLSEEAHSITNSLSAIKGFGRQPAQVLLAAAQHSYTHFVDLLRELDQNGLKGCKVEPLIRIDYFESFGNAAELLAILELFSFLQCGEAKQIRREKADAHPILAPLIAAYAKDRTKSGSPSAFYRITDMEGLLRRCEDEIKTRDMPDFTLAEKISSQMEILGAISLITGREEDRRKLIVLSVSPLKNKKTGEIFGVNLVCRSLGSGKQSRLSVYYRSSGRLEFKPMDVLYARYLRKTPNGYWELRDFKMINKI